MSEPSNDLHTLHAVQAQHGEALWFLDALVIVKQDSGQSTDLGVLDYSMARGSQTPLHRHLREDEAIYVLDGQLRVLAGEQVLDVGRGAYARLPAGVPHALIALTDARFLVLAKPDGFVALVREMGEPAGAHVLPPSREPDLARLLALTQKYQIEVLGPAPELPPRY